MTNFNKEYLNMLKIQVADEIDFLVSKGHEQINTDPCMFCQPMQQTFSKFSDLKDHLMSPHEIKYRCERLQKLREFQSVIAFESHKANDRLSMTNPE